MNTMKLHTITGEMSNMFVLSVAAFLIAMLLTPLYTTLAYKYHFGKSSAAPVLRAKNSPFLQNCMLVSLRAISPLWQG